MATKEETEDKEEERSFKDIEAEVKDNFKNVIDGKFAEVLYGE